jgi:carboxymethylenebutenolidase
MLITKTYQDVPSKLDGGKPIRIFIIAPNLPNYPNAKFPGTTTEASLHLKPLLTNT